MRNERGLTLVELLAVLVIFGIIMALIATVLINGTKVSDRSATNQKLQQEANYITEVIRKEYLKQSSEPILLEIDNYEQSLKMNETTISQGYIYYDENKDKCEKEMENEIEIEINRNANQPFLLVLCKDESLSYEIDTTFSKLR